MIAIDKTQAIKINGCDFNGCKSIGKNIDDIIFSFSFFIFLNFNIF
jgi:hypothetical protein